MKTIAIAVALILLVALGGFLYVRNTTQTAPTTMENVSPTAAMQTSPSPESSSANSTESATPADAMMKAATKEFTVSGSNFTFDKKELRVKKGDTVKVTFKNTAGMHDFVLPDYNVKTAVLQTGGEETVTFTADKAGSFEYFCSVGKHREMGMKGMLVVE